MDTVKTNHSTIATVHFSYSDDDFRSTTQNEMFDGFAEVHDTESIGGLLYGHGKTEGLWEF